jgi:N-acetylmuramoyl-L-alanine amidase
LKSQNQVHRALRCSAALVALLLPAIAAHARVHKSRSWADSQFAAAEHLQELLEGRPTADRARRDYEGVINAYRRVYLGAPSSSKADPSVVAAAQMTEEMGRRFTDPDVLRSAIQQYEFLRREYPGSKYRFDALFRIGEIYKDDLHDKTRADAAFQEFLRRYPRNQFAAAVRQALAEPAEQQATVRSKATTKAAVKDSKDSDATSDSDDDAQDNSNEESDTEAANAKPSRVIGIRHWSMPDYTRVVIDLEHGVTYHSQRIDNPDRIFFDLQNTKLDSKLSGKTFDVSDGLLKAIRMSQFKAGRTRVVLDLDGLSEANASLLSNPARLIIDIRNKDVHNKHARDQQASQAPPLKNVAATNDSATEEKVTDQAVPESVANTEEPPVKAAPSKPALRTTVVVSNGVKKTIVDAEDDDRLAKNTIAKLDLPKPDVTETRNKPGSDSPATDHVGADAAARPAAERRQDTGESPPSPKASTRKRGSAEGKRKSPAEALEVREAQPTASGDRSLIRALGLKIGKIVIDPGHGGHDTGTIGPNGLEEKDLVLDVSRRLGKLLQTRLGAEVIYTRKDDTFIPLETRTAIANQESADLFVSVHANSSHDSDARGVETYYLNFTSSPEALEVAARENAVSEESIHELQDLVKKIALKEKIEESHEFASDVQRSLHSGLAAKNPGLRDRGVKKAPFIVLIGANMPSILAEISFVSNPGDERRLETADYRQKIAESLYRGIAKYVSGLSGVKVASKIDKEAGQ